MKTLQELRELLASLVKEQREMIDSADTEKRDLTEEEETRFTELDDQIVATEVDIDKEEKRIDRANKVAEREKALDKPVKKVALRKSDVDVDEPDEFRNLGEFFDAVLSGSQDVRLAPLYREQRSQSMGVGAKGGFMVPTKFRETLLSLTPQQAIFRPRANVIPAGDPPDAEISMPALDQDVASAHMYAGVDVQWISEGGTKPETDMNLREIKLAPHEVAGYIKVTDKLLRNWDAASAVLGNQLRMAITAAEENAFYNGNGVGKPLGVLNSPARIDYSRATVSAIDYSDILGMFARFYQNAMSPVWIASQTIIPQLGVISDGASQYIYQASARDGMPGTLFGIPIVFHDRSVALGTKGDLILADLGYYMIKDGSGPFIAASEHVYFTSNQTVIKVFWNVDGQPWLNAPIKLEGSTANTVSPFIVLN